MTLDVQRERCEAYCKAMNYEVIGCEFDEAKSGKDRVREGLDRALRLVKAEKAVLVVYDLSRLSRDVVDGLSIVKELTNQGCFLADLETGMHTSGRSGKLILTVLLAMKQYQREETAERTSEAMQFRMKNGQSISSKTPYGWALGDKFQRGDKTLTKLTVDPAEQELRSRIINLFDRGMEMEDITALLNAEGQTCRGARWHRNTIKRIIANREMKAA